MCRWTADHEDIWGTGRIASPFLTLALDRGEWLSSRSGRFTSSTPWIGGWVGTRAGLDTGVDESLLPLFAIPTELYVTEAEDGRDGGSDVRNARHHLGVVAVSGRVTMECVFGLDLS
jgi:hypothetical protein